MHPASRGGPSLTFDCKEPKRIIEDELHPEGKGFPSLEMGGAELKRRPNKELCSTDAGSPNMHVDSPRDTPTHAALTSPTIGEAVDGEKCDPREMGACLLPCESGACLLPAAETRDGGGGWSSEFVDPICG